MKLAMNVWVHFPDGAVTASDPSGPVLGTEHSEHYPFRAYMTLQDLVGLESCTMQVKRVFSIDDPRDELARLPWLPQPLAVQFMVADPKALHRIELPSCFRLRLEQTMTLSDRSEFPGYPQPQNQLYSGSLLLDITGSTGCKCTCPLHSTISLTYISEPQAPIAGFLSGTFGPTPPVCRMPIGRIGPRAGGDFSSVSPLNAGVYEPPEQTTFTIRGLVLRFNVLIET